MLLPFVFTIIHNHIFCSRTFRLFRLFRHQPKTLAIWVLNKQWATAIIYDGWWCILPYTQSILLNLPNASRCLFTCDCAHCNDTHRSIPHKQINTHTHTRAHTSTAYIQTWKWKNLLTINISPLLFCRRLICRWSFQVILVTNLVPSSRHVPELDEIYDNLWTLSLTSIAYIVFECFFLLDRFIFLEEYWKFKIDILIFPRISF